MFKKALTQDSFRYFGDKIEKIVGGIYGIWNHADKNEVSSM
jgi:hypothetical protein